MHVPILSITDYNCIFFWRDIIKELEKNVCSDDLYDFLGMCDPPDVEPDDTSEANYQNSFVIGIVEDKENIEIYQLLMLPMGILKL